MSSRNLLALCALALAAAPGLAQPGFSPGQFGPANTPAVSPYLNLLRPSGTAGFNYYGLVRPQMEFRNGIQDLQFQQQALGGQAAPIDPQSGFLTTPGTGHAATFLYTGGYYSGIYTGRPGGAGRLGGGAGQGFGQNQLQRPMTTQLPPAVQR
jgi:hypothetical protein